MFDAIISKLQGVNLIYFRFSNTIISVVFRENGIDYANIKPGGMEEMSRRDVVIPGGLHDDVGLTRKAFEELCQLFQFTFGVRAFKGLENDLPEVAHDYDFALSFGNVDADPICLVMRTQRLNLLKLKAVTRGWLTALSAGIEALGTMGQMITPLIVV